MIDENAFGALFSYHGLEDEEYADDDLDRVKARIGTFARGVRDYLREHPPGQGWHALDLGHAVYVELADGDQTGNLIPWLKAGAAQLKELELNVACVLSFGGRWVDDEEHSASDESGWLVTGRPSEPFRRALYAETATHGCPNESSAWGPGVYVDTDAVEAMGLAPKNRPTTLEVAGAEFFRLGS